MWGGNKYTQRKYRLVKRIEDFHSTLKDGLLKQQTSAALLLYHYVIEELNVDAVEWKPFEELLEQIEILLQDNPVASAQRHDPIPEEHIRAIYEQVETFRVEWEQALLAVQENYKLIQSMLRKDVELMGTQWLKFMYSIQDVEGSGVIAPYDSISLAQPTGQLRSLLHRDGFYKSVANLEDNDLVIYHRELSQLTQNMHEAIDKAERFAIKQKGIQYSAQIETAPSTGKDNMYSVG